MRSGRSYHSHHCLQVLRACCSSLHLIRTVPQEINHKEFTYKLLSEGRSTCLPSTDLLPTLIMVSSEPLDNSPLLPLSALSASGSFSLSSSGSLQTHLSSFNSEQRLRSLPSVTDDLEKQADPDSDDEIYDEDTKQTAVKQRFWWLARAFVWFSVLFFPISVLGDYGFLSRRPPVNPSGGDYEPGSACCRGG